MTDTSGVSDLLSFTDEAGVYQVRDGFGAKATDEDGTEYISSDGILTIPAAGKYTIESIFEYISYGFIIVACLVEVVQNCKYSFNFFGVFHSNVPLS